MAPPNRTGAFFNGFPAGSFQWQYSVNVCYAEKSAENLRYEY